MTKKRLIPPGLGEMPKALWSHPECARLFLDGHGFPKKCGMDYFLEDSKTVLIVEHNSFSR